MEYEFKRRGAIEKVFKRWKKLLRLKLGRKTFPMIGAPKGARKNQMKKYLELCNIHIAAMEALSGIELTGIRELDARVTVSREQRRNNNTVRQGNADGVQN